MSSSGRLSIGRVAAFVVVALLCTGCQLGLLVDVRVDRNGGGTVAVAVSADPELLERASGAGADPLGVLVERAEQLGAQGWRVSDRTGEQGRTVTLSRDFADPDEFNAMSEQLAGALAADEARLLDGLRLALTGDRLVVAGEAAIRPTRALRDYGLTPRRAIRLLSEREAVAYEVAVTLPGEVLATTAQARAGSRLVWTVAPGERVTIAAEGSRPGLPWLRGAVGALAGGLLAAAGLWLLARRRNQASARSARMRSFSART